VFEGRGLLVEIGRAGFFNVIEHHPSRASLFWFLFTGLMMILCGQLCFWIERQLGRTLPAFVGWELLILSVIGAVLMPISGIWLILAQAIYIIVVARRATVTTSNLDM
jgi:hypothetical protein